MCYVSRTTVLNFALVIIATFTCFILTESTKAQDRKYQSYEFTVQTDVSFMDGFVLDIYMPHGPGPFPTTVTLHGASGGKAAMEPITRSLVEKGWVVYNANWLSPKRPIDASLLEKSFEAAGCALRFAAATALNNGGDGEALTVVGLSAGGLAGALVSLAPSEFGKACRVAEQDPTVDLFIGLEGAYLNAAEGRGGLADAIRDRPELATRLDPRTYLNEETNLRVVLFLGNEFRPAVAGTKNFYEALRGAGIHVEVRHTRGPHLATTFTSEVLELLQKYSER